MKFSSICMLLALLSLCMASTLSAELFTVARVTDLRGNENYQVVSEVEKRKIESELGEEAKALPKVIDSAKSEWAKALNKEAFPTTRIKPRTLKTMNTAISREDAEKLLLQIKLREERSQAKEKEEDERALKTRRPLAAFGARKLQVREDRKEDQVADRAETLVRKQLAATVGHAVPFYGTTAEEPKNMAQKRRK